MNDSLEERAELVGRLREARQNQPHVTIEEARAQIARHRVVRATKAASNIPAVWPAVPDERKWVPAVTVGKKVTNLTNSET